MPGSDRTDAGWTLAWEGALLMGIVNVTPDSFSDGGRFAGHDQAVAHGLSLARAGARIVDVGGESTRPGAAPVDAAEESARVLPVIEALVARSDVLVSIDTTKPQVAREAVAAGAHLVNDVTGLRDPDMLAVLADAGVPGVAMHMQGRPRTMQREPRYQDVVAEVEAFLVERAADATRAGVPSVILDPGLGFGKTVEHNLALVRAVPRLAALGHPLLIGGSRKQSIGTITGVEIASARDPGSIALHLHAAARGAGLLRVHDVAGHAQALAVWRAIDG